jgi:protein involved in polysaccharide export with SLBB domain
MATKSRVERLAAFGAWVGLCLVGVGCQAPTGLSLGNRKAAASAEAAEAHQEQTAATQRPTMLPDVPATKATVQAPASLAQTTPAGPKVSRVHLVVPAAAPASSASAAVKVVSNDEGPVKADRAQASPPAKAAAPITGVANVPPRVMCEAADGPYEQPLPTELKKVSHPPYMIEPPDILLIDSVRLVPRPPYRVEPLDVLIIQAAEAIPNQPIAGPYPVSPDGTVNLGFTYGTVRVAGLALEQAEAAIRQHLGRFVKNPQVAVVLGQFRGVQQTRGEHLVRPDGTISLGTYGGVYVAGLTIAQAKCAIEQHLSRYLLEPQISIDVFAYNSKFYYVIADGGGYGQQIFKLPATGNETVLDALSNIGGLPVYSSKRRIWVARPAPPGHPCDQVLPVDWNAITQGGSTATNWQLFPGDRIYVKADCLIATNNFLTKVLAPIEQLLGVTLLGASTVNELRNNQVTTVTR